MPAAQAQRGVFVLPLRGEVGKECTAELLQQFAVEVDRFGPGQMIVLEIDGEGGLVSETYRFHSVMAGIQGRHRVVAWVKQAIGVPACLVLMAGDVYFAPDAVWGTARGSPGCGGMSEAARRTYASDLAPFIRSQGHQPELLLALLDVHDGVWYRADGHVEGAEVALSQPHDAGAVRLCARSEPLQLTADSARECGLSRGAAASHAELAALLGMPEWSERSDVGRRMEVEWCLGDAPALEPAQANPPRGFACHRAASGLSYPF